MPKPIFLLSALLLFCLPSVGLLIAADPPAVPDFTRGDKLPANAPHDWNLGATGARGWVYAWRGESTASRQILITEVAEGSPSDGVLLPGDVIAGLNGQPFDSDSRIAFAKAISAAEASNDGTLNVIRWRNGRTENASIQLSVLGAYSDTAPYDCEKSRRILENGCEAIARQLRQPDGKRRHVIVRVLNALALLASGEEKYLSLVKAEADWAAQWQIEEGDLHSWSAGWVNLFLAEYLLATGDASVRPAVARLSYEIAVGQSRVGTWGHRFAYEHNGILRGYGAMNQVGLSLTASLVLARQAGVRDPEVDAAIARSRLFLEFYAGKGAIPYGDHHPWLETHDDNGKASAAAVMFDLLEAPDETAFFSKLGTASYGVERETGHTGNFFNMLWALPGISRSGPEATGAWVRESAWLLDLARTWDGSFDFLGKPAASGGEHSYTDWDCTGAYLIGYSVARKKTVFSGAQASVAASMSRAEAQRLIEDGRGWMPDAKAASFESRTVEELLVNLSHWSPIIRERAALALATKTEQTALVVPRLIALAGGSDIHAQFGACSAFEQLGKAGAQGVPVLTGLLTAEDYWLRAQAAEALAGIGEPARVAIPALLKLVAEPPQAEDHRGYLQRYLAFALFDQRTGLIGKSLAAVDHDLLRQAAEAILKNQDGRARGSVKTVYDQLDSADLEPLLPAIYTAVVEPAPSGVMFSDGIRIAGLDILAKQRIAEGLPLCLSLIELDRWGGERRLAGCLAALKKYGDNAHSALPQIRDFAELFAAHPNFAVLDVSARRHNKKMAEHYQTLQTIISDLETAGNSPSPEPLRTLSRQ